MTVWYSLWPPSQNVLNILLPANEDWGGGCRLLVLGSRFKDSCSEGVLLGAHFPLSRRIS